MLSMVLEACSSALPRGLPREADIPLSSMTGASSKVMRARTGVLEVQGSLSTLTLASSAISSPARMACTVIKSNQIAVMQHDPYSWEVLGKDFVHVQELTADSRFLSRTFKSWLAGMTPQARGDFFDAVFGLLATGTASRTNEILQLKNVRAYLKTLVADEDMRSLIASEPAQLLRAARSQTKKSDILENGS